MFVKCYNSYSVLGVTRYKSNTLQYFKKKRI